MTNGHFESCTTPLDCWCEIKRYGIVFGVAAMIFIAEVVGGIVSHSLALLADAGHVFTDSVAIIVAVVVAYRVKNGAPEQRNRAIGGYINALLLGGISVWIAIEAWERFQQPREVVGWVMMAIAVLGTIGNYVQHKVIVASDEEHATHESLYLHILSDMVQSFGVVIGGILIWVTSWRIVDPVISMLIALWMAYLTWKLLSKLWSGKYDGNGHCGHGHNH